MKRLQTIAAYLFVLVLAGVSSLKSAEPGNMPGHATVRTTKGNATYTKPGGAPMVLHVNQILDEGDTITTGPDSVVYVSINGVSSAVRVAPETTLVITRMQRLGTGHEGDTDTGLDLKIGSIVGQVKKVTASSRYEISTPHGVAGIRGTDFEVDVVSLGNGQYSVTFTSIQGTVVASAVVNGDIQTKTLTAGEQWTVGGDVIPVTIQLKQAQINLINDLIANINLFQPGPVPVGPVQIRPQPTGGTPSS